MKSTKEILRWLKANDLKLGGLTSHDTEALLASVAICPLISWSGAPAPLFEAYRAVVLEMQPFTRHLAFHAVAMELDWSHRFMIWNGAGLQEFIPTSGPNMAMTEVAA